MQSIRLHLFVVGLLLVIAAVAAPSASAALNPRYARFAGCPDRPEIAQCIRADTPAGNIKLGNQNVPISQVVTISGGFQSLAGGPTQAIAYNSQGGITGNPLEVPGGLAGLTGISEFILNLITFGANKVYAQAELVSQPRLTFFTFDLSMAIKVNLRNPFLRSGCSIGSAASPINLTLIVGTTAPPAPNRPISGHPPANVDIDPADPDGNTLLISDVKHVDNSFSAPRASSACDLIGFGLISGLIDSRVGLPSAAGRNEAVFDRTNIRIVAKSVVYP